MAENKSGQETVVLVGENDPPSYSEIPGVVPSHQGSQPGPPPSYDDVTNPNAPPPSYHSLFGQVREARRSSSGVLEFVFKVILILIGTLGCTIICGLVIIFPIIMVVIGSLYLHECPVQPYVPIYLVVGGVFSIVKQVLQCVHGCIKDKETPNENKDPSCIKLLNLFLFAWFIAGCVWVYGCYEPVYDNPEDPLFCNKTVYLFSFWLLNSFFIFFGISLSIMCCIIICAIVLSED